MRTRLVQCYYFIIGKNPYIGGAMKNYSLYNIELLSGNYYPRVAAYYYREFKEFNMDFHSHNRVEIMYVLKGKCLVETNNRSFRMKNGDFILLDANIPHNLAVDKDFPCRMLNIEFIFAEENFCLPSISMLAGNCAELKELFERREPFILLKDSDEIYSVMKNLIIELDGQNSVNSLIIQLLLSQLLIMISRLAFETGRNSPEKTDIYIKKAVQYIQHNYDRDLKVKDIAEAVNLHPIYFHRIFKSGIGCSVMEYVTKLRMEKAKMLLARTDIPIIDISGYIGINSRQHFSYLFRKSTGIAPSRFRKTINRTSW